MSQNKYMQILNDLLSSYGFKIVSIRSKKHLVIKTRYVTGEVFSFVTGVTPSDYRALRNLEGTIRRTADALVTYS